MKSLINFIVIVLSLNQICAQSTVKLIPIPEALTFGPKTHERLIVPVEPTNNDLLPIPEALTFGPKTHERIIVPVESIKKEPDIVTQKPNETKPIEIQAPSKVENAQNRRTNYIQPRPISHINHYRGRNAIRLQNSAQEMQPLHVNMRGLSHSKPNHTRESVKDKRKRFGQQEERIKMQNLPPNPKEVPETTWFDNLGKYNYGIVHDFKYEDLPTVDEITDNAGGESKELAQPAPQILMTTNRPEIKFRSSFRDPTIYATLHSENDNMGKFLYKTRVYYPNYRDHIYLPVTTFYGHNHPDTKELPIFNAHTIIHNQPQNNPMPRRNPPVPARRYPISPTKPNSNDVNVNNQPKKNPPVPPRKYPASPPKKYLPISPKKSPPLKTQPPKKEPPKKLPPPPPPPKEEPKNSEEDYDYEEEDDDDYDDSTNDKHANNSSDDDEYDEEDESSSSSESNESRNKNSNKSSDSDESEEGSDQFDKAWAKFGYGKDESSSESDSYESSESQNQPERVKIVHMKMEVQTTPHRDSDFFKIDEDEAKRKDTQTPKTPELEAKKKRKNIVVTNQKPHPNAGPDDLKYFQ